MEKIKVYVFKVAFRFRKGLWRRIEIKGNQTLADFDHIVREAFAHDQGDHLSEFYRKRKGRRHSEGFGIIEPGGGGVGAMVQIWQLGLRESDELEYVYDFGDNIQHIITLEKIKEIEKKVTYPRIIAKNKPRYRYCEECEEQGKKTVAQWICIECSDEEGRGVYLCDECATANHDDHWIEEIVY